MRYNRIRRVKEIINKPISQIIFYIIGIIVFLFGIKHLNGFDSILDAVLSILKNDTTISVFFIGILTLVAKSIHHWANRNVEESEKTESDHRKIILKYKSHGKNAEPGYSYTGDFLKIHQPNLDTSRIVHNPNSDIYSGEYVAWEKAYTESGFPRTKKEAKKENENAILTLSSVSIYANSKENPISGITFDYIDERYSLPEYVHINAQNLLRAHSTTALKNNQTTIRLRDVAFENNTLNLFTERTTYYEMLMTNRCMDYEHHPNITLRQIYEYKDRVTDLGKSRLCNQIGINGLVITSDGYLLIEKRDLSKSTWKDKFSQPISLAMKRKDVPDLFAGKSTGETAEKIFAKIIAGTLKSNYSITESDYDFSISENFLGLARDLLEGGKPNLYFMVTLKISSEELKARMEKHARCINMTGDGEKALASGKLKSYFYLIHKSILKIDSSYSMTLRRKNRKLGKKGKNKIGWMYINRMRSPRSNAIKSTLHLIGGRIHWIVKRRYTKEVSEALLVCLAYMQLFEKNNECGENK